MLVLRRRVGEAILITGDIEIEVIEISRTRVKLGIKAPREVKVDRRELISAAQDNRHALDILRGCGGAGVNDFMSLLPAADLFAGGPQVPHGTADK